MSTKGSFRKYQVKAESAEEFLRHYYRRARFQNEPGFHFNREERMIADAERDVKFYGYIFISRHDSNWGEVVSWYPEEEQSCT